MSSIIISQNMQNLRHHGSLKEEEDEDLRNILFDLDQSIQVNKNILQDVVSTLVPPSRSREHSNDTQTTHLISSKIHDKLLAENARITLAINRIKTEIEKAEISVRSFEEKAKESRKRKKEYQKRIMEEAKKMRQMIHHKEDEIQRLEEYRSHLDEDIEESQLEEQIDPDKIIEEGKRLVSKVTRQMKQAEEQRDLEAKKCKELEDDIKKIQTSIKAKIPVSLNKGQEIIDNDYSLNLNYESYWFETNLPNTPTDTLNSSDSAIQDQILPNKYEFASKNKPYLPKLNLSVVSQGAQPDKKQSPRIELSKLELALQIKCEEISSLQRILGHLEAQEYYINKSVNKAENKL